LDKIGLFADSGATSLYFQVLDMSDREQLQLVAEHLVPKLR